MTNKKIAIPLVLALFIGVLAWWQVSGSRELGQMELEVTAGQVDITRDGKTLHVDGTVSLQQFDVIKTFKDSEAELRLSGDRNIKLGAFTQARILDGRTIENERGELKALTTDRLQVQFGDVIATASDGHFRVDRGFSSARAASYSGSLRLDAPGQTRMTVRRLFEARVSAGDLPAHPRPYNFDPRDEWDWNVLEPVIRLDGLLNDWATGLAGNFGDSRPGVAWFSERAERPAGFVRPYLQRPTTDLLIGFSVAQTAVGKTAAKPLGSVFEETMQYRQDGGAWGVVAEIMGAEKDQLRVALGAVTTGTGVVADGSGAEAEFDLASDEVPGSGDTPSRDDDSSNNNDGGNNNKDDGNNNDDNNNDDDGNENPPPECTSEIECAGQEIADQLPGDGEPDTEPSPSPDDGDPLFGEL